MAQDLIGQVDGLSLDNLWRQAGTADDPNGNWEVSAIRRPPRRLGGGETGRLDVMGSPR